LSALDLARNTLAGIALEGAELHSISSDSRLTRILNRRSAAEILQEIVDSRDELAKVARASYAHSHGFDKVTLISNSQPEFKLRLHMWWPTESHSLLTEFVHNHRWVFRSTMLCGSTSVEFFSERAEGRSMHRYEYRPRDQETEAYDLRLVGQSRLSSDLIVSLTPGSTYSTGPGSLHRVLWPDSVSITMFVRWASVRRTASVFSASETLDPRVLSAPSFGVETLQSKLLRTIAALDA